MKIKAYHGSNHEITKFSDEFAGGPKSIDAEGPGIYLTNSRENAEMWGKYTYELILSPRKFITNQKPSSKANRIDMKKFLDMKGDEDYANNWSPDIETDKLMAINEAIKYNETEDEAWHSLRREQYNGVPQAFMRAMSKLGYDMMTLKKDFDFGDVFEFREWLVKNIKGIGYKEASHFLRNIGYDGLAIIDFHIIDVLEKNRLIRRPKTLTRAKYLEIEKVLKRLADRMKLTLAELDL